MSLERCAYPGCPWEVGRKERYCADHQQDDLRFICFKDKAVEWLYKQETKRGAVATRIQKGKPKVDYRYGNFKIARTDLLRSYRNGA